jgi:hypothetical protein
MSKSIAFSTKAGTLRALTGVLQSARIAPLVSFTLREWQTDRGACLKRVKESCVEPWIVRSSARSEDDVKESKAGAYLSLLNVGSGNLEDAIVRVGQSYDDPSADDEILIQSMVRNVVRAGVGLSHDPSTCAPYRVITWADGADTTAVTSGRAGRTWQQAARAPRAIAAELHGAVALLDELLSIFQGAPLDFEFAVSREGAEEVVWLLQVRPLVLRQPPEAEESQTIRLRLIEEKIEQGMRPHPFLLGRRTAYGVMPDWNPAEIIGVRPQPLALSLYRDLVTDSIWAYQRHNYGYRNLRSFPLMPHFVGLPYIDVRLVFNSFIPADLDDRLAGRLVDYYLDRLLAEPKLHDKVEFEIVFSCYSLDLPERLSRLEAAGFSDADRRQISDSLRRLTNRIVHRQEGLWRQDAGKLDVLNARREELLASEASSIERIYWLVEDAKRYGTLPFAGLARAGFVAIQILKSLVAIGLFSKDDYDGFLGSVSTVGGQMARDRKALSKPAFLARYGHLRPGTYDILSPRYDEAADLYFEWDPLPAAPAPTKPFSLTLAQMRELTKLLENHGLGVNPVELFDFLQAGIELREMAKFQFTKNLSDVLELIAKCGDQWGISRQDLAYADIAVFRELYIAAVDPREIVERSIEQGKLRHRETLATSLPPLITQSKDVWGFEWPETEPNFITQKQVIAPVSDCSRRESLDGAIICIPNADPGFDWIFAYPIAGLATAWGGMNSHMAIRASELGLPAVIGAGEANFRRWSGAKKLHLDCANRRVEILA